MSKTKDSELIFEILTRIARLEARQLIGVYEMLVYRERYLRGDRYVNIGPKNAEQLLVFLRQWEKTKIYKYDQFINDLLTKIRFKRSRWYLDITEKSYIIESKKVKEFLVDLKRDLEIYIINVNRYDMSLLKSKYL